MGKSELLEHADALEQRQFHPIDLGHRYQTPSLGMPGEGIGARQVGDGGGRGRQTVQGFRDAGKQDGDGLVNFV